MTDAARLRYLSVCSGIEAATVAWHPLGWEPAAFSEIEAFPRAVLAHHYPDVPNWGDMTKFKEWPDADVDVLVGGTPCQSFSVAGLRKGMDDPRGNLALTYLAIAARYRPQWLVWENVPGVLSSNGGRDFGSILGGMVELGYGIAYRVLDAQYFRVPQRRRRVFVVGYLGDWRRAAAVLFERESLLGNPAPRREAGERIAPTTSARTKGGGGLGTDFDCDGGLIADTLTVGANQTSGFVGEAVVASTGDISHCLNAGGMGRQDYETETLIAHSLRAEGFDASEDGTGRGTPIVTAFYPTNRQPEFGNYEDVSPSIKIGSSGSSGNPPAIAFTAKDYGADAGDISPTLRSGGHDKSHANDGVMPAVAFSIMPMNSGKDYKARETDIAQPIMAGGPVGGNQGGDFIAQPLPFDTTQITSKANYSNPQPGDPSHPLAAGAHAPAVAFDLRGREGGAQFEGPHDTANIRAASGGSSRSYVAQAVGFDTYNQSTGDINQTLQRGTGTDQIGAIIASTAVRRLTPEECEALQGFPRGYTFVPYRGKPAADGPRYKALGNSMAVPCMRWLGERIQMVEALT